YRVEAGGLVPLASMQAEFGLPQWVFGQSTYTFAAPEEIYCTYTESGMWRLARWTPGDGLATLPGELTEMTGVVCDENQVVFIGASPVQPAAVLRRKFGEDCAESLRESAPLPLPSEWLS